MRFTTHTIQEILPLLQEALNKEEKVSFEVLNPDISFHHYAGEAIEYEGITYLYRGYKSWVDLAQLLKTKMLTPFALTSHIIQLTFKRLEDKSFHQDVSIKKEEKYGKNSHFFKINKMEEPAFYYYYQQALENIHLKKRSRILNLGINRGDEFRVIDTLYNKKIEMVGVDYAKSAITYAKQAFSQKHISFYHQDINKLASLKLGKFDVLISIGTLQSSTINFKPFFMGLVQNYLEKNSAIILGFPNSRWIGGEMVYGAKAPHYAMSELSLVFSDIIFAKKYLQQHKYRVTLTGKEYLFLTATSL